MSFLIVITEMRLMMRLLLFADTSSLAVVNAKSSVHPGKETLDELADKERFFQVFFPFILYLPSSTKEQL